MKQEDKELLLKDLTARLLYGVKVTWDDKHPLTVTPHIYCAITSEDNINNLPKLLLRPMSSMTEEEMDKVEEIMQVDVNNGVIFDFMANGDIAFQKANISIDRFGLLIDYFNERMLDWRGLIDKGLAIAVTEENNPYKK